MMVDVANQLRLGGADATSAIRQACALRFRPIMMTTAAAILGTVPLALGFGAGGDVRQSLGLVVLGGLLVSQLVTLYATPVFFVAAERLAERLGLRRDLEPLSAQTAERTAEPGGERRAERKGELAGELSDELNSKPGPGRRMER